MRRGAPMKRGSFLRSGMRKQPATEVSNESSGNPGQLTDMGNPISSRPPRESIDFIEESSLNANFGHHVKPLVRGTYGPVTLTAAPKTVEHRNPDLLALARGKKCLLTAVDNCRTLDGSTTVACHQNEGKGMARKADDEYSVWGCMFCHQWYDRGPSPRAEKRRAFDAAHERQRLEWARIVYDMSETPKARRAAEWALLQLPTKEKEA